MNLRRDSLQNKGEHVGLLDRHEAVLDVSAALSKLAGTRVLVSGAAGSIGQVICQRLLQADVEHLIAIDHSEHGVYELTQQLRAGSQCHVVLGDVRAQQKIERLLSTHRIDTVFHAAAYKHVTFVEEFPEEGVRNNVFGCLRLAQACDRVGVGRVVQVSTDKAVCPVNVMGATKRLAELLTLDLARDSQTDFVICRFGNVLRSHGSVVPRFERQLADGESLTVTHEKAARYFMTMGEAQDLILQAWNVGDNGDICLRRLGSPVQIVDLAKRVAALAGKVADVKLTELCPGERLQEALYSEAEETRLVERSGLQIIPATTRPPVDRTSLEALRHAAEASADDDIRKLLYELIG